MGETPTGVPTFSASKSSRARGDGAPPPISVPSAAPAGRRKGEEGRRVDRRRLIAAFEGGLGRSARFHPDRHGPRLDWAVATIDAFSDFGRGRDGAGVELLEQMIEGHAFDERDGRADRDVGSLAYFVPILEEVARDFRRHERHRKTAGELNCAAGADASSQTTPAGDSPAGATEPPLQPGEGGA